MTTVFESNDKSKPQFKEPFERIYVITKSIEIQTKTLSVSVGQVPKTAILTKTSAYESNEIDTRGQVPL